LASPPPIDFPPPPPVLTKLASKFDASIAFPASRAWPQPKGRGAPLVDD